MSSNFKIVLDSNDTSSYIGNQYDAQYFVDFTKIINDPTLYDKQYMVSYQIMSMSAYTTNSGFNRSNIYGLTLEFGNNHVLYQFGNQSNGKRRYYGTLEFDYDCASYTSTTTGGTTTYLTPMFIKTLPSDNSPIYLNGLRNINFIGFRVINSTDGSTFVSTNDATNRYVCILNIQAV